MYYLSRRVLDILNLIKLKVTHLIRRRGRELNIDVFSKTEKYLVRLSIEKIVADPKVSPEAIDLYKKKIEKGEKITPIIVVKHPKYDVYAVLDGHHRYYAYLELSKKEVN